MYKRQGLQSVEDKLVKTNFKHILEGLEVEPIGVKLKFPKFRLSQEFDLTGIIKGVSTVAVSFCYNFT